MPKVAYVISLQFVNPAAFLVYEIHLDAEGKDMKAVCRSVKLQASNLLGVEIPVKDGFSVIATGNVSRLLLTVYTYLQYHNTRVLVQQADLKQLL